MNPVVIKLANSTSESVTNISKYIKAALKRKARSAQRVDSSDPVVLNALLTRMCESFEKLTAIKF
jgi:hypothetical protein